MNIEELIASLSEGLAEMNAEQIDETLSQLADASAALLDDPTDEDLDLLSRIADAVDSLRAEQTARAEAATERATRAAELAARISGSDGEGDDDADDAGEGDEAGDDAGTDAAEGDEAAEPEGETAPEAIAAAAPVVKVASRRDPRFAPRPRAAAPRSDELVLTASANIPGVAAGSQLRGPEAIANAFVEAITASTGYQGMRTNFKVGHLGNHNAEVLYGEDRFLDSNPRDNARKIAAITSPQALRASGGICAPTPVQYDQPVVGSTSRPVRDGLLVRFGADRGGIRTLTPPKLSDVSGGVGIWDNATDIFPDGATKDCDVITCPEDTETIVQAITKCLTVGNFQSRYFAERVEAWLNQVAVAHARLAEQELLAGLAAFSTAVTAQQNLGATRDVLAVFDRLHASWSSRRRIEGLRLRVGLPFWLRNMIRADLAREMPGSAQERLAAADNEIDAFFAVRNINITWLLDGESGQQFPATQGTGPLAAWPSTTVGYAFEEGSMLFLDGGSLDLGITRDSTLNRTNDFQMFSETFEAVHFHGSEAPLRVSMSLCPDGSAAALQDTGGLCTHES